MNESNKKIANNFTTKSKKFSKEDSFTTIVKDDTDVPSQSKTKGKRSYKHIR